jgi:hypothetical protein
MRATEMGQGVVIKIFIHHPIVTIFWMATKIFDRHLIVTIFWMATEIFNC